MRPIRLFAFVAVIVGALAGEARAQVNPNPWPATWACQSLAACLRINNTVGTSFNSTALELYSNGSRTLFTHSDTDGAILSLIGTIGVPTSTGVLSVGARFINYGQGQSASFNGARGLVTYGTDGPGATSYSTLSDAVVGIAATTSKSGGYFANSAAGGPSISGSGDGYLWNGTWYTTSTRRFKKDVVKMSDGLKRVLAIEPVWFSWIGSDTARHAGVIAEELQLVAPELVKTARHTSALSLAVSPETAVEETALAVDYGGLAVLAIDAVKQVAVKQSTMEERLAAAEKRIAALEAATRP